MDDLITWLRAQLDDDERVARQMLAEPGGVYLEAQTPDVNVATVVAHLDRWTPKRVLAEVDAKRQRIDWIEGELADDSMNETARWLARLEALPYAGRPGYREEW